MKDFIRVMKALSDPSRIKIIKMLGEKEMCVCEMTAVLELAQPTVSKHMKVLEDAGLVDFSKQGSWVNYRLVQDDSNQYAQTMLIHMKKWLSDDKQVMDVIIRAKSVNRSRINAA
ncbi:MAG: metalloregulator ArsR/SmtB family transcription factor [Desulfobulbaceae bacterium]|nr:metalloregulator ArsR/SmtB family transcription factor [Desulfobulbaceae bacterium]